MKSFGVGIFGVMVLAVRARGSSGADLRTDRLARAGGFATMLYVRRIHFVR